MASFATVPLTWGTTKRRVAGTEPLSPYLDYFDFAPKRHFKVAGAIILTHKYA
jgi:hypothetical protein